MRIAACAICHSDIAYADGAWGGALPAVYGHEAAGRVTAVGPGVTGFAPGDRGARHADPRLRRLPGLCRRRADLLRRTPGTRSRARSATPPARRSRRA